MSFFTLWSGAIMLLCCGSTSCQAVWRNAAPSAGGSLAERQRSVPRRVLNCGQNARGSGSRVLTEPSSPPGEKHKNESQQSSLQCCSPRYFDFFNRPLDMWRLYLSFGLESTARHGTASTISLQKGSLTWVMCLLS